MRSETPRLKSLQTKTSSEKLVPSRKTTRRHNPEDQSRHPHLRENFKSQANKNWQPLGWKRCFVYVRSTRNQTVRFTYVTSLRVEGKQTHVLCKPKTSTQEMRQRATKYCHWEIMFIVWTVYAPLSAAPPTPLIPLQCISIMVLRRTDSPWLQLISLTRGTFIQFSLVNN
jgi:hypothetical protein